MLVKELRQGLRARSFIGVFLALHIILGIILLSAGAGSTSDHAGTVISSIIFAFFAIAVLIVQPLRGITSLSSEIKGNTIDMMVLTRLSAWRIVTGKWFAIVSQSALILVTIIPYLILRYFFGGMNLFGEMILLTLIFITSAALTAITVGLSASSSIILRAILPVFGIPIGTYILMMVVIFSPMGGSSISDFCSLATTESQITISIYIAACAYLGFFLLAIGTSLIAPYAENHSTLRRLVALVVTIAAAILSSFYVTDVEMLIFLYSLIFFPIFTVSLTEFTTIVPPTYKKFSRLGLLGKIIGPFLLPGWPTGFFFCIILTIISYLAFLPFIPTLSDYHKILLISQLASFLFPAVIINVFKMKGPARVSNYILFLAGSMILSSILFGVAESMSNPGFLWLFVWVPMIPTFMSQTRIDEDAALSAAIITSVIYFGILFVVAIRNFLSNLTEVKQSIASTD